MLDKLFQLSERGTTVKTEILAGITTFITMAYILFLAPNILSLGGMDKDAVLIATAYRWWPCNDCYGFIRKLSDCPRSRGWPLSLLLLYRSSRYGRILANSIRCGVHFGLVFLVLTLTSIRQMIVEGIPASMKVAITVGIGLFIAIIGLKLSGFDGYLH